MNPIKKVAIIGECMIELKKKDDKVEQGFGGDTLNTAVYLSRLTCNHDISVSYLTGLGKDPFSREMLTAWQQERINTDLVNISDAKLPGMYAIETSDSGERSFFYWRNDAAAKYWLRDYSEESLAKALCQFELVYLSGISLAILPEDCRQILFAALKLCKKNGVQIAFDNNYRPKLWSSPTDAQQCYKTILQLTDIAFLTYEDEQLLWGDNQEEQAIRRTQGFGVQEIVVKRGSEACFVITDQHYTIPANKISNVVDTTAAGDSFSAGYLAKRILGGNEDESAATGHLVAGTVIQHRGAIIPSTAMPAI